MTPLAYQKLALRTMADQRKILGRLMAAGAKLMQIDNAARGLCNDAGEVSEIVKNVIEYGKPWDEEKRQHMKEELGDLLWRVAQMCDACEFTIEEVMQANISKLAVRFGDKYDDWKADPENRDRAAERVAIEAPAVPNQVQSMPPGCELGTDNDGNCPAHPRGCPESARRKRVETAEDSAALFDIAMEYADELEKLTAQPGKSPGQLAFQIRNPGRDLDKEWNLLTAEQKDSWELYASKSGAHRAVPVDTEPTASFGDGLVRADNPSYSRPCQGTRCSNYIHRSNTVGLCPDCHQQQMREWKWVDNRWQLASHLAKSRPGYVSDGYLKGEQAVADAAVGATTPMPSHPGPWNDPCFDLPEPNHIDPHGESY